MKKCYSDFVDEVMDCLEDSKCYLAIMPNDEGYDIEVEVNEGTIAGNYFTGTKNLNKARKIAEELEAELVRRGVNVFKTREFRESWEDFLKNENKEEFEDSIED